MILGAVNWQAPEGLSFLATSVSSGTGVGGEGSLPASQGRRGLWLVLVTEQGPFIPDSHSVLWFHSGYRHMSVKVNHVLSMSLFFQLNVNY